MSADGITKGAARAFAVVVWSRNLRWTVGNGDPQDGSPMLKIRLSLTDRVLHPDAPPTVRELECTMSVDPSQVPDDIAEGYGFAIGHLCIMDVVNRLG